MHHQAGVNCEKFTEVKFRDMLLTRTGHQDRRLNYHSPSQTCGRSNLNQNLKPKSNFRFIRERPFAIPSFHQKWRPGALSPAPPCRAPNSGAQSKWWRDTYSTDVNNANNYVCLYFMYCSRVLFNLFVIVEPLLYFRIFHGTPINKNLNKTNYL